MAAVLALEQLTNAKREILDGPSLHQTRAYILLDAPQRNLGVAGGCDTSTGGLIYEINNGWLGH